jgi:hypothetical protein
MGDRGRGGCFSQVILATPRSLSGNVMMQARTNAKVHQEWKHNLFAGKIWVHHVVRNEWSNQATNRIVSRASMRRP